MFRGIYTEFLTGSKLTKFISISLDISGSTKSKNDLVSFASKHNRNVSDLYEQFAQGLLNTERTFLNLLCAIKSNPNDKCAYELERLFLIKTIGDEWWYSYSIDGLSDFDVGQHARHLFKALLAVQSKTPICVSIPSSPTLDVDGLDKFDEILRLDLPLKITCDLISGFDIGHGRYTVISSEIANCIQQQPVLAGDEQFQSLMSHLGAIVMISNHEGGTALSVTRSDFVGMEVDRFFRLTAMAQSGRILIGKQLLELLEFETNDFHDVELKEKWQGVLLRNKLHGGFTTLQTHIFMHCESKEGYKLKGITSPYQAVICTDRFSQSADKVWCSRV